jgi:tyrosyl-tRNA synthetase
MKQKNVQELLTKGVEEVIVREHLEKALTEGRTLRIKHGIDPTGPKLHLGHAVILWKLREFQKLGHQVVIIIGGYTAQIGDPSDKLHKRPFLTEKQVKGNMASYKDQLGKILNLAEVEFRNNSEWLKKLTLRELDGLAELFSFQQMVERRNFKERFKKGEEISLREFHYPLYQGFDSVKVKADVEIGGSDQLFNLLAGRKIQEAYGQKPQDIITMNMLFGLDGQKMSKTAGNTVSIDDGPDDMFGKLMSLRDELIPDYALLCARKSSADVEQIKKQLQGGANPRDLKMEVAETIVALYHGKALAKKAAAEFTRVFQKKELPENLTKVFVSGDTYTLLELLLETKIASSKGEARRLIAQGGIKIDGKVKTDSNQLAIPKQGITLQKGKHVFVKVLSS